MTESAQIEPAISAIFKEIEDGWNRFDLDAYAPYYTVDATYITRGGAYLQGRDAIKDSHRTVWADAMRGWRLAIEPIFVRPIGDDHVFAHARLLFTKAPGEPPFEESLATVLLARTPEGYRIQAAQTTAVAQTAPETRPG
jgi:uncharacterized protein (TIGR02246 family)